MAMRSFLPYVRLMTASVFTDNRCVPAALCQRTKFFSFNDIYKLLPNKFRDTEQFYTWRRDNCVSRELFLKCHKECKLPVDGSETSWLCLHSVWRARTCVDGDGKLTPSSFRVFIVELRRLSCASFWKSSAHSTISALSFSHTLEWAYSTKIEKLRSSLLTVCFPITAHRKRHLTHKWCTEIERNQHTLPSTVRTSLAKSLEQISKWNPLPQLDTHTPSNWGGENIQIRFKTLNKMLYA